MISRNKNNGIRKTRLRWILSFYLFGLECLMFWGCRAEYSSAVLIDHIKNGGVKGNIRTFRVSECSIKVEVLISNETVMPVVYCLDHVQIEKYSIWLQPKKNSMIKEEPDYGGLHLGASNGEPRCMSKRKIVAPNGKVSFMLKINEANVDKPYCSGRVESGEVELSVPFLVFENSHEMILEIKAVVSETGLVTSTHRFR